MAMPLTPRHHPDTPQDAPVSLPGESVVAAAQRCEAEQFRTLLRALRGEQEGIPADVLEAVRQVAAEGRPTYSE